ncbi:glucuronate isomerase [Sporomusa malonica]|uniref:Uronate isomerase n=1 Tax=Sporomusa malonica TaxID=112901 RepID=A0A1W2C3M0_9FIRM|nr:glucuronate isomerase [Sporomusa malonica]SMC79308.1 glucuronate isomerase [Sporomusa malonica]
MKPFMDENFLLTNKTAETLYHNYAKDMPIFDYHCHLNPQEIAENKRYRNITEVWLGGDHYKWRALRSNGVDERYITGDAPDKDKFMKWAETMPQCLGNPLFHWTHLELKAYFGIDKVLCPATAEEIWEKCNALLQQDDFTARGLIERSNVKVICTTDDPADSLEHHTTLAKDNSFTVKVLPTFRPDKSFNIEKSGFAEWLAKLGQVTGTEITTVKAIKTALAQRVEFFHQVGCRVSDHALDPIVFAAGTEDQADEILKKALNGQALSDHEIAVYKTTILVFLGKQYARLGWTMQLHMGTIRNNNSRLLKLLGPDTGFDAIGDFTIAEPLAKFLDALESTDELPKTILYCLNPRDNDVLGTIIGCFQGGGIPGKIQFGSGWWFNDQKDGMIRQMVALANLGLLSRFVGMLTDSRSFLSYTRHEYFRRILCNLIGEWVEAGEFPNDTELLGSIVQNISFNNAKNYFGIEV